MGGFIHLARFNDKILSRPERCKEQEEGVQRMEELEELSRVVRELLGITRRVTSSNMRLRCVINATSWVYIFFPLFIIWPSMNSSSTNFLKRRPLVVTQGSKLPRKKRKPNKRAPDGI